MKANRIISPNLLIVIMLFSCNVNRTSLVGTENELINMDSLISILKSDFKLHKDVESPIADREISITESELGIKLPSSYKHFLKEFGNGAYWLYHVDQPINGVNKEYEKIHWLGEYRNYLGDTIESDGFGTFETKTLLCLMTENSNGGAWVWITTENKDDGEWPLAYYSINDRKLYYRISNFIEWLKIATKSKEEVIRQLDIEYRLGLG